MRNLTGDLAYYDMAMRHLSLYDDMFNREPQVDFRRHMNRLYIHRDWSTIQLGSYIIVECQMTVDQATFTDIWSDEWLKLYATALIKQQWGSNLKKFEGMQLPGGTSFNGQAIYDEASEEIRRLEEQLELKYEEPVDFHMG